MWLGVFFALVAGLFWGLVFVAPVLLPEYPPALLTVGRYVAFGAIALPLALADRTELGALRRDDWGEATKLSLVGNLVYYAMLAAAIQSAGAPLPTMIIGTLPVVIAVVSNVTGRELPWRRLAGSLVVIAAGIALVNRDELVRLESAGADASQLWAGALLATGAVACWTWYPIRNARWMRGRTGLSSRAWATAQGLTTLPLALAGLGLLTLAQASAPLVAPATFDWPLGPRPLAFVSWMLAIGLCASWLGTLCWNRASQLLPTSLAGQLIVFETLSALLYAFVVRRQVPGAGTLAGIALLVLGVVLGVRAFQAGGRPAGGVR